MMGAFFRFGLACCLFVGAGAAPATPNVIFVLVDDWGSYDAAYREKELRPEREPQLKTPVMDRLASEGVKLDSYYVQHICTPTRSNLLSGRYQIHTGLQHGIIQGGQRNCLPPRFSTIADAFKTMGYSTHMVGKWHLGLYKDACLPWNRGFDSYYGFLTGSEVYYSHSQRTPRNGTTYPDFRTENGPIESHCISRPEPQVVVGSENTKYYKYGGALSSGGDIAKRSGLTLQEAEDFCAKQADCKGFTFEANMGSNTTYYFKTALNLNGDADWVTYSRQYLPNGDVSCYSTHEFMNRSLSIIRAHDADSVPLFLYLALQNVHEPVMVPAMYADIYKDTIKDNTRKDYAGMVSVVDEALGNLTDTLAERGMLNNTVLVVSNDNGGWFGYGGINFPYRGHKTTLWEGGLRGLGFVHAPGRIASGTRMGNLFHVSDWLPTLVRAAGVDVSTLGSGFAGIDGVDQWSQLTGDAYGLVPPRKEILHLIDPENAYQSAIRVGDYKMLLGSPGNSDKWCDVCNLTNGCNDTSSKPSKTVQLGGMVCQESLSDLSGAPSSNPQVLLFDIATDPREQNDLSSDRPDLVAQLMKRLQSYNASAVPVCYPKPDMMEMNQAPIDGYWGTFHDQSDPTDPSCALLSEGVETEFV